MTISPMRVLIVDDEPIARRGIRQLLASYDDIEIAGEACNGAEAVRLVAELAPDLVFLDVQMPELDGFAVLRRLDPARLPAIIFVTAFDTFAVRAFETRALDYLVKPVAESRFREAVSRARERFHSAAELALWRRSLLALNGSESSRTPARRILIGGAGSDLVLDVAHISWIEADDYYAAVHSGGKRHLVRESLASLEGRLDQHQFVRAHRRAIVNLAEVHEIRIQASGESLLVLNDGSQLPLSRRRRQKVEAAIRRFAG